jgi:proline iminopeptidase
MAPEAQQLTVNGARIRYQVSGNGAPVVVQAPGWGIGAGAYGPSLSPLAATSTLVSYDPRGSGNSQRVVDPTTLNVGQFVADLDSLRAALSFERVAIVGHSHGGYIALNYALAHPDRVSRLVLVDSQVGGFGGPSDDFQQRLTALSAQPAYADAAKTFMGPWNMTSDADMGAFLRRVLPLYFHDVAHAGPLTDAMLESPPSLAALQSTMATDGSFPVLDRLDEIAVPVLVIGGRHDFICPPSQMELLASKLPNARLVFFEHSGHFPWIEEPEAFFPEVTAFLNGV